MITAKHGDIRYQTLVSNGEHNTLADTTADKGGSNSGFRPHDLLEAALAACMSMTLRMAAEKRGIHLEGAEVKVSLDRSGSGEAVFDYSICFAGDLGDDHRSALLDALTRCPVRSTLSRGLGFRLSAQPL